MNRLSADTVSAPDPTSSVTSLFLSALEGLERGTLRMRMPAGDQFCFGGHLPGPDATVRVEDERLFRRMLTDGEVGAGTAYIEGEWTASSLVDVITLGILNRARLRRGSPLFWLRAVPAWIAHRLRRNSLPGARRNIVAHYDLGNEFFETFLDASMTYSSALFETPEDTLEAAQRRKYEAIANRAGLTGGEHVLEIGCGWGGFAEHAARMGCRVTGITLSPAQAGYARERIQAAGVADRVEIQVADYRTVEGRYDAVVSIEMLEAVGHAYLRSYFQTIDRVLVRGGRAAIQVISIPDRRYLRYRLRPDFIQRYIFPGAHLPSLGAMTRAMARSTRLVMTEASDLAPSYALTLARWRDRLLRSRSRIRALGFDEPFIRTWEYYFAYCQAAFRTRYVADYQLTLQRSGELE